MAGKPARQWHPYAKYLEAPETVSLRPGDVLKDDLFISAGLNGWDLADPGIYQVQAQIMVDGEAFISKPVTLQIGIPQDRRLEMLAQDAADTLGYQDFTAYCKTCADWDRKNSGVAGKGLYEKAQKTAKFRLIGAYPRMNIAAE